MKKDKADFERAPVPVERAMWAVHVFDAWAKKNEVQFPGPSYLGVTSKVDGARLGYWRIFRGLTAVQGDCRGMFRTADDARICAAEGLVAEDPSLAPTAANGGKETT